MYTKKDHELVSSNLNVITVSLENSRRIRVARQTGDLSVDDSNVDKYARRENFVNVLGGDIMDMNLDEFFKAFELNSLAVPKRRQDSRNIVLRVLQVTRQTRITRHILFTASIGLFNSNLGDCNSTRTSSTMAIMKTDGLEHGRSLLSLI